MMTEIDSGTEILRDSECPYITSVPIGDRWGQLPASLYRFTIQGDSMRGQFVASTEEIYVSQCRAEYPAEIDSRLRPDQSWFWTPQWQAMEQEADDDLARGRYEVFESMDDLIADLERLVES